MVIDSKKRIVPGVLAAAATDIHMQAAWKLSEPEKQLAIIQLSRRIAADRSHELEKKDEPR